MPSTTTPSTLVGRLDQTGIPLILARLVLGGLFIYMGAAKIGDPVHFLKLIREYHRVPPGFAMNSITVLLPWLEVLCGTALMLGLAARGAALVTAGMLAAFTPVILLRALSIQAETGQSFSSIAFDCGCGGGVVIIWKKLLENSGLFGLCLIPLFSKSRLLCFDALWRRPSLSSNF